MRGDLRRVVVYVGCAIICTFAVGELFGIKVLNAAWGTLLGTMISGAIVAGAVEKINAEEKNRGERDDGRRREREHKEDDVRDPPKVADRRRRGPGRQLRLWARAPRAAPA